VRIAFVITRLDDVGGAQIHVRDLSTTLQKAGYDPLVLAGSNGALSEELQSRGVPCYIVPSLARSIGPLRDLRGLAQLRHTLRQLQPDIISTHSTKAGFLGRIAGQSLGIPTLFTAHGWGFTEGRPPLQALGFWAIERATAPWAARIITVCESDRQAALRKRLAPAERLVTIYNAMPDVDRALRARPELSPPRLVMVARLSHWKDQPTLLRALSGLKELDWHLDLIGDGPLRQQLEALVHNLDLASRVSFLGYRNDIPQRLAQAQIFLLISKWEGFPRSILEGMRAGLPVVTSDVGGVRESVVDAGHPQTGIRPTGYVVPAGDVTTLRELLHQLITNPELRLRLGRAGRARYEEKFTFERLLAQMTDIYESVLTQSNHTQLETIS